MRKFFVSTTNTFCNFLSARLLACLLACSLLDELGASMLAIAVSMPAIAVSLLEFSSASLLGVSLLESSKGASSLAASVPSRCACESPSCCRSPLGDVDLRLSDVSPPIIRDDSMS